METSKLVITLFKSQNVARRFLGKFVKFGGDSFNLLEVTQLQSWCEPQAPPLPPGLNRVKLRSQNENIIVKSAS